MTRATKSQRARMAKVKQLPCVACKKHGLASQGGITEVHHLISAGRRRGHDFTVSLCVWHHRAVPHAGFGHESMRRVYGPSLAEGSKPFHEAFGSDDELLAETNRLIA